MGTHRGLPRPRVSGLEHRSSLLLPRAWLAWPARDHGFLLENCRPGKDNEIPPGWLSCSALHPPEMFLFLILAWAGMWLRARGQGAILGAPLPSSGFGHRVTPDPGS